MNSNDSSSPQSEAPPPGATTEESEATPAAAGDAPLIQVAGLRKSYGSTRAVDGVSFSVNRGEIRGFLGPNGAGKSTTIRSITGYQCPDAGDIKICGLDVRQQGIEARERIGYLPESLPLYWEMRVDEYLEFMARSRGLSGAKAHRRVSEVIDDLNLGRMRKRATGSLSKGYRQRVGLAQAIVHDPDVLILDEPTNGLDPEQIIEIRELLLRLSKTKAILFSTHILQEISAICTRVMIIRDGKLIADGTPEELTSSGQASEPWELVISGSDAIDEAWAEGLGLGRLLRHDVHLQGRLYRFGGSGGSPDAMAVAQKVKEAGRELIQLRRSDRTLEQVYLDLTTSSRTEAVA